MSKNSKRWVLIDKLSHLVTGVVVGNEAPDESDDYHVAEHSEAIVGKHKVNPDTLNMTDYIHTPSTEEIRAEFKEERTRLINELTVTHEGLTYDADEISRSRMADTIVGLEPLETHLWVLADNSVIYPTRETLKQVLRAIGTAQTAAWVQ